MAPDDPHWRIENARVYHISSADRKENLIKQLRIGDAVNDTKKTELVELLLHHGEVFVLIWEKQVSCNM